MFIKSIPYFRQAGGTYSIWDQTVQNLYPFNDQWPKGSTPPGFDATKNNSGKETYMYWLHNWPMGNSEFCSPWFTPQCWGSRGNKTPGWGPAEFHFGGNGASLEIRLNQTHLSPIDMNKFSVGAHYLSRSLVKRQKYRQVYLPCISWWRIFASSSKPPSWIRRAKCISGST